MKILICGVGNTERQDDGAGIRTAELLSKDFNVIFCHTYPERFIDEICLQKPDLVLIVDAADFGGKPGEFREIQHQEIDGKTISTHTIPLSLFAALLEDCSVSVKIFAVQVKNVGFGQEISPEVKKGVEKLVVYIKENFT